MKVLSPPKQDPTVEDKAFLAAFDKLMLDDIQNRREENPKVCRDKSLTNISSQDLE